MLSILSKGEPRALELAPPSAFSASQSLLTNLASALLLLPCPALPVEPPAADLSAADPPAALQPPRLVPSAADLPAAPRSVRPPRPLGLSGTQAAGGARAPCANSELIHSSRHSPTAHAFLTYSYEYLFV